MHTAREIAEYLPCRILHMLGDGQRSLMQPMPLNRSRPGTLTFAAQSFSSDRLLASKAQLEGTTIICPPSLADHLDAKEVTILVTENPRLSFMRAVGKFFPPAEPAAGIHPSAVVDPSAVIHKTAHIGAHCVIGGEVRIGADSVLHPNVVIYEGVSIGARCRINSGTVIGADGFGYERNDEGQLEKFPHIGSVEIEDDVEIGSNTSIDRGSLGNTVIRNGARIDNQVHIAHNVVVGARAAVIAQAMIGGSVKIGDGAWIAPGGVIMNQVSVGANATVGLGAVATKDVPEGATVMGSPAQADVEFKATRAMLKRLLNG